MVKRNRRNQLINGPAEFFVTLQGNIYRIAFFQFTGYNIL